MSGADYFTYTPLIANTLARASDVNSRVAAIQGAFGRLPHYEKLQQGRASYVTDSGGPNVLVVSLDFAPSSYVDGLELTVRVGSTNTGAATVNVNGLGAKAMIRADGSALLAGDLTAGQIVKAVYDGTSFRLLGASETAIAVSIAAAAASATSAANSSVDAADSAAAAALSATASANSATAAAASAVLAATAVAGYLPLAGGIMTGPLVLAGAPTSDLHAATKKYVDDIAIAAGSFTADGASITLSGGQFSLTTIATARLLGNVSGSTAKPVAVTGTQVTALLDTFAASLKGLVPPPTTTTGKVLADNGAWVDNINGNAASATALQTPRTIAISGAVTGTATSFGGSANITIPITALDVGAATTGTLAVARGGTGVTTSTGSGSNVLSDSPTFTGTANFGGIVATGNINGKDIIANRGDGTGAFFLGVSGARYLYYDGTNYVLGGVALLSLGASPSLSDATSWAVSSGWVTAKLAGYSPAFTTIVSVSGNVTLSDAAHQANIVKLTGAGAGTITADSTPTTGFECSIFNRGTVNKTFSCAGGCYLNGATATVTSITLAPGAQVSITHEGAGVWSMVGTKAG